MRYQWNMSGSGNITVHSQDFVSPAGKKRNILSGGFVGTWYPAEKSVLEQQIRSKMEECVVPAERLQGSRPSAVILPHAGYDYSLGTAGYALKLLEGSHYKKVIILGPSHRVYLSGKLCVPSEGEAFAVPGGSVAMDQEGIAFLKKHSDFVLFDDQIHEAEHSVQVLLPMLQYVLGSSLKVLPVITGVLSHEEAVRAGKLIKSLLTEETLLVISSDFTHYGRAFGYVPFRENIAENLEKLDLGAFELLEKKDPEAFGSYIQRTGATICGEGPLRIMLSMLGASQKVEKLHYTTSSAESGDYSHCVSYLSGMVTGPWEGLSASMGEADDTVEDFLSAEDKKALLQMARGSIEYVFEHRKVPVVDLFREQAPESTKQHCGCFVTLTLDGVLRGCIGEIEPYRAVYQAVTARAVDAAFRDTRFRQLTPGELRDVRIEISVLTPPRKVSSYRCIRIGQHGMTLSLHGRSAVFLPQVAPEQNWTLEETLHFLSLKAGLSGDAWKDPEAQFSVFEAIVFHEDGC